MNLHPAPPAFDRLAAEWQAATQFSADPSAAATHPAYHDMVALGVDAVPLILAALRDDPDPAWVAALLELTGADPVPYADRGRTRAMAGHWLAWGNEVGRESPTRRPAPSP